MVYEHDQNEDALIGIIRVTFTVISYYTQPSVYIRMCCIKITFKAFITNDSRRDTAQDFEETGNGNTSSVRLWLSVVVLDKFNNIRRNEKRNITSQLL